MKYFQNLYDTKILPLYREVVKATSTEGTFDPNREEDAFVIVEKIRETNLYRLEKAYHKPRPKKPDEKDENNESSASLSPYALKRYHPSAITIEIRPKHSQGFGTTLTRYEVVENELKVMDKINDSVFVQKLLDVLEKEEITKKFDTLRETWLKFEFCSLGSLADLLFARSEAPTFKEVSSIACQILRGLEHIHSKGIIHGELTSKNVLIFAPGVVKLSNFALSIDQDSTHPDNLPSDGPLFYTAPEKLRRFRAEREGDDAFLTMDYTEKIDIWSLGILLLEMFLKTPPLHRACAQSEVLQQRYILFMTDLASPQRSKGSALYHLFYPHYDIVKEQIENEVPLDIDILTQSIPQLAKSPTDSLIVLMGFKDDKARYQPPETKDQSLLPRFKKLWRLSSFFDFVRQCLFLRQDLRPSASLISEHAFVAHAFREIVELEPDLPEIIDRFKTREGRKQVWIEYKTTHTLSHVNDLIKKNAKRTLR